MLDGLQRSKTAFLQQQLLQGDWNNNLPPHHSSDASDYVHQIIAGTTA
jgi:hypothetical protein